MQQQTTCCERVSTGFAKGCSFLHPALPPPFMLSNTDRNTISFSSLLAISSLCVFSLALVLAIANKTWLRSICAWWMLLLVNVRYLCGQWLWVKRLSRWIARNINHLWRNCPFGAILKGYKACCKYNSLFTDSLPNFFWPCILNQHSVRKIKQKVVDTFTINASNMTEDILSWLAKVFESVWKYICLISPFPSTCNYFCRRQNTDECKLEPANQEPARRREETMQSLTELGGGRDFLVVAHGTTTANNNTASSTTCCTRPLHANVFFSATFEPLMTQQVGSARIALCVTVHKNGNCLRGIHFLGGWGFSSGGGGGIFLLYRSGHYIYWRGNVGE